MKPMKRFGIGTSFDDGKTIEICMTERPDGGYVRFEDVVAAVAAERERCAELVDDLSRCGKTLHDAYGDARPIFRALQFAAQQIRSRK